MQRIVLVLVLAAGLPTCIALGNCCDATCTYCTARCGWCGWSQTNCQSAQCSAYKRWCPLPSPSPANTTIRLGAIRWDSWSGSGHDVTADATVRCMSPPEWHGRVPFCGKVLNSTTVDFDCASPDALESELEYAVRAGVDYWAFVQYPSQSSLSLVLENYLAATPRRVHFAVIMDGNTVPTNTTTSGPAWDAFLARYNSYFSRPDYESVDGKPLVFWFIGRNHAAKLFGSTDGFKQFAAAWAAAADRPPHFVLMEGYDDQYVKELGFNTRSSYALGDGLVNGTFDKQRQQCLDRWNMWSCASSDVLPLAALGWDPRPRATGCAPWLPSGEGKSWTQTPTPTEVVGAIRDAIDFACDHPSSSLTGHVLLYAWNEITEGGWLVPTLGEGDARVRALEAARAGKPWTCSNGQR